MEREGRDRERGERERRVEGGSERGERKKGYGGRELGDGEKWNREGEWREREIYIENG